jgi:sugar phosphate isomerase/epimerase
MRLAICNETSIATELIQGGYDKWVSVEVFDTSISPETLAAKSMMHLYDAFPA